MYTAALWRGALAAGQEKELQMEQFFLISFDLEGIVMIFFPALEILKERHEI